MTYVLNPVIFSPDMINICQNSPIIHTEEWISERVEKVEMLVVVSF